MKTNIEYADEVSNPLFARLKGDESSKIGTFCEKPDKNGTCENCWAEVLNLRFGNKLAFDKSNRDKIEWLKREKEMNRLVMRNKQKPMSAKFPGLPLVVFCCDTFDIFQPSISDEMRDWVFNNYDYLTNLILLIQTTYPAKMNRYFKERYGNDGLPSHYRIGMSAGTQDFFDRNINHLKTIKAKEKYVIFEPLLEQITFNIPQMLYDANVNKQPHFTFAIVGGESGHGARICREEWIRSISNQCKQSGVFVLIKQMGKESYYKNVKQTRFTDTKGAKFDELPLDLQIREMPV